MFAHIVQITELTRISSIGPHWIKQLASNLQKKYPLLTSDSSNIMLREVLLTEDSNNTLILSKIEIYPDVNIRFSPLSRLKELAKFPKTTVILIPDEEYNQLTANKLKTTVLEFYLIQLLNTPSHNIPSMIVIAKSPQQELKVQFNDFQLLMNTPEIKSMLAWHTNFIQPSLPKQQNRQFINVSSSKFRLPDFLMITILKRRVKAVSASLLPILKYSLVAVAITFVVSISLIVLYASKLYSILSSLKLSYQNHQFAASIIYSQELKNHCKLINIPYPQKLITNSEVHWIVQLPQACISIADLSISTSQIINQYFPISTSFNSSQFSIDLFNWRNKFQQASLYLENPIIKRQITKRLKIDLNREKISAITDLTNTFQELSSSLNYLLGIEKSLQVIVLLQNNNELRPTGGFIGSVAQIIIDKGALTNMEIKDVYDYDGRLLGHVNPPQPIKNYLNQPSWFLRDSNWSPDFPTSAQNVAWFLDKSAKITPNLIIGIDTEVFKYLLSEFGPMNVQGINNPINEGNFQAILSDHIETDFFPGSRRKTNSLGQLGSDIKHRMTNADITHQISIATKLIPLLNQKHILIHSDNQNLNQELTALNWNGRVGQVAGISSDSETLYFSPTEANLGVNKVNQFIDRKYKLNLNLDDQTTSELQISYINNSKVNSKIEGDYRTYIQFPTLTLNNPQSYLTSKTLTTPLTLETEKVNNYDSTGTFFVVPKQSSRTFILTQKHKLSSEYIIYFRKQPGTINDPIDIEIISSSNQSISLTNVDQGSTLTGNTHLTYNTNLKSDLFLKINLK